MSSDRKGDRISYMKVYNGSGPFFSEVSGVVNYYWSKEPVASWADTANGVKCLVIARFP